MRLILGRNRRTFDGPTSSLKKKSKRRKKVRAHCSESRSPRPSYAYVPLPQGMRVACIGVSGTDRLQPSTSASLRSSCGASFLLSLLFFGLAQGLAIGVMRSPRCRAPLPSSSWPSAAQARHLFPVCQPLFHAHALLAGRRTTRTTHQSIRSRQSTN